MLQHDKKHFLFKRIKDGQRARLLLDEEALYSTTDQITAEKIANTVLELVGRHAVVIDATACIGGSALSFANTFDKVIAIEKDPVRFRYLEHNITVLDLRPQVACVNADLIDECPKYKSDVIFIDPPWGGPEYKTAKHVSLFLSNQPLASVCCALIQHTRYLVIKVPTNFDEESFVADTKDVLTLHSKNTKLRKMILLILRAASAASAV